MLTQQVFISQSFDNLQSIGRSSGEGMTLTGQLKGMLDTYLDRHPNVSINALAMKSGIGATTLRRLKNDDIKGDPAPHTVLSLVSALTNEKRLSVIVETYDGPLGEVLKSSFGPFVEKSLNHSFKADLNSFLRDSTSYFVFKLCANRNGTTWDEIESNYGKIGLEKLNLLEKNHLIQQKEKRYYAKDKDFSLDPAVTLSHLPQLVSHFKLEEAAQGNNLFYTMSESLNEEGLQKIKSIQKEAVKKIIDIMKSPFYEGDIPYFSLNMCDSQKLPDRPEIYQ